MDAGASFQEVNTEFGATFKANRENVGELNDAVELHWKQHSQLRDYFVIEREISKCQVNSINEVAKRKEIG